MSAPILDIRDLSVTYPARGTTPAITALTGLDLTIAPGETLALVGGSGSGKSTLARAIFGLVPEARGSVQVAGTEIIGAAPAALRRARSTAQMVFQDAAGALDPRRTIGDSIAEPLVALRGLAGAACAARVADLLATVGLDPAMAGLRPGRISGGQRQRVGIARALAIDPALIVWDEPVSSLDVSVRAGILNLLMGVQRGRGLASLFISHDLAVVRHIADRIAVIAGGRIVDHGSWDALAGSPHPETRRLIAAMPARL